MLIISLTFDLAELNTQIPAQLFSELLKWLLSFSAWLFEEV